MKTDWYAHPKAIVESTDIGKGTKIWAFSHVQERVKIGDNCNIGEGCFIENGVHIGNNVVIKNNISVWKGVILEDNVFLGPNVVLTNDLYPRAKVFHSDVVKTVIKMGASIGANATILCGNTIGRYAIIGGGSVVTKDVPDFALVFGNPASFRSWVCVCTQKIKFESHVYTCSCGRRYKKISNLRIKLLDDLKN